MLARRIAMLLTACAALAAPVASAGAQEAPSTGGTAAPSGPVALSATPHVLAGGYARFSGTFDADRAGRTVAIERFDAARGGWVAVAGALVAGDGSYSARWRTDVVGRQRMRAVLGSTAAAASAGEAPVTAVTVYRPATASWYGPGLYGRTTACGKKLTRKLVGVAHRTLPCGTRVALTYRGKSLTVPVVDRGPFRRGRSWDLTAAAAKALGFTSTDRIGALPLTAAPAR